MRFFVTGTDTDVGKTIVSSWLMLHLNAQYWKPVQSGIEGAVDAKRVEEITQFDSTHFHDSTYSLKEPLSPHEAARREGVNINLENFQVPDTSSPLIVEGAGGLYVPLNDKHYVIDLMKQINFPIILVCRSTLGTINHTLLSIKAIKEYGLTLGGIVINGPKMPHNRKAIETFGKVPVIAEIDHLPSITKDILINIKPELDLKDLLL